MMINILTIKKPGAHMTRRRITHKLRSSLAISSTLTILKRSTQYHRHLRSKDLDLFRLRRRRIHKIHTLRRRSPTSNTSATSTSSLRYRVSRNVNIRRINAIKLRHNTMLGPTLIRRIRSLQSIILILIRRNNRTLSRK